MTPTRSAKEIAEYHKFLRDPAYACDHYGIIDDAQGVGDQDGAGETPFRLWPAQMGLFWDLQANKLVQILKARQLGISWCVCWFIMWSCSTQPGQHWMVFSKGKAEANEMIRRIRVLFARLPDWLLARLPCFATEGSKSELQWSNGSRVMAMPATASAGVSYTASGVVMDEADYMPWGPDLYSALKPTVDSGRAKLIMLSTANGIGSLMHRIWTKAQLGENSFKCIFLPWWSRPDRDAAWYRKVVQDSVDPKTVPQFYPANPNEAFLASGRTRFPSDWVLKQAENIRPALLASFFPDAFREVPDWPFLRDPTFIPLASMPGLSVFSFPKPGHTYAISADVAEGKTDEGMQDPDYDAAIVVDLASFEEVACLHGRWDPDVFAKYLMVLAATYQSEVIVERNNHGHGVLSTFRALRFPWIGLGHDDQHGWLTNLVTKPLSIDLLAEFIRENLLTVRYGPTVNELQMYLVGHDGKTSAPRGDHDDLVMAWAILLAYVRDRRNRPHQGPPRAVGSRFKPTGLLNPL